MRLTRAFSCLLLVGAACGAEPDARSSTEDEPPITEPAPLQARIPRTPRAADFGCRSPTSGLASDGLIDAGRTATVASSVRLWTVDALQRLLGGPLTGSCEAAAVQDALATDVGPARAIRLAAGWLGESAPFEVRYRSVGYDEARQAVCGDDGCVEAGTLPEALTTVVAALLLRLKTAVEAETARRVHHGDRSVGYWASRGGEGLLASTQGTSFDPTYGPDVAYLSASRAEQYEAAAALADAVMAVDWTPVVGRTDVSWRLDTPWGPLVVADGNDHEHAFEAAPLLLIDLGGDDTYRGLEGSSSETRPVAVVVDLEGADVHSYPSWSALARPRRFPRTRMAA